MALFTSPTIKISPCSVPEPKFCKRGLLLGIATGLLYPQAQQGTGSLIYNRTSAATPLSTPNAKPAYFWTNALAVQAAWELDFWGKFRRGVEAADGAYLASIATYDDVLSPCWVTWQRLTSAFAPPSSCSRSRDPMSSATEYSRVSRRQSIAAAAPANSTYSKHKMYLNKRKRQSRS